MIKLIAFDLDGTLTQHKSPICDKNRRTLDCLAEKYKLLMVGAGEIMRIFHQLGDYPMDIIGNYGLQYGKYNNVTKKLDIIRDLSFPCDRERMEQRVFDLRQKYGYTDYVGDAVEYHPSGCVTIPLLGTKAALDDKLAFDPQRIKRRKIYDEVRQIFSDYVVFVGGTSSFDLAPKPYDKFHALDLYCRENGLKHDEVTFCGDDYGLGGNDESVFKSDIPFVCVDHYLDFPSYVTHLM